MSVSVLEITTLHEGWTRVLQARLRDDDGGEFTREIVEEGDSVAILPYDPGQRIAILVSQFRAPVFYRMQQDALLEVPAGRVEDDGPAGSGRREMIEEIGIRSRVLEHVATVWSSPGASTERKFLYLSAFTADDLVGEGGGLAEENEDIAIVRLPLAELARMSDEGRIADSKTLALVYALRLRHPELFAG